MKKLLVKRFAPFFLSVALVIPYFAIPAEAALTEALSVMSVIGDVASVMEFAGSVRDFFSGKTTAEKSDWHMDSYLAAGMADELNYYFRQESLEDFAEDWNVNYTQYSNGFFAQVSALGDTGFGCVRLISTSGDYKGFRVLCTADHTPILCENYESGAGRVDGALPDKWVPDVDTYLNLGNLLSYEDLYNKAVVHDGIVLRVGEYYLIYSKARDKVLADPSGLVYKSRYDNGKWAAGSDRGDDGTVLENGVVVEGDVEGNVTNIDLGDMTLTLPDGSINFIDQIIYDESTKTYHIDAHDEYNTTINNYYTWNYYINYTSITYIGQTEEYNKYYEVYYELPDGRDSADLTKEELEQLNLSIDVIPYGRSADDTSLRSLYHFDGDTRDSSYWNYCTNFIWNKGASLTYMDSGVFDGALYLDETEHDFTIKLPSDMLDSDFTLQFRYYQSATAAPVTDSYINFEGAKIAQFNGLSFCNGAGSRVCYMPIGTWNELSLIRSGGTLYYYLNGVAVGSVALSVTFGNEITFHFGSEQQTYKYFDELRVLDFALCVDGSSYEPTSVPHDSNLTLVLPDSSVPVADEYWIVNSSGENLIPYGIEDYTSGSLPSWVNTGSYTYSSVWLFPKFSSYMADRSSPQNGVVTAYSDFMRIANTGNGFPIYSNGWCMCLFSEVRGKDVDALKDGGTYTYSVVTSDGEVCSVTFVNDAYTQVNETFDWGTLSYATGYRSNNVWSGALGITPNQGSYVDIIYMELIEGSETDLSAEWVESVTAIDRDDLNTPTLAVRTDIDITSYQIGGVRPSVPTKGQVWALVENERITSIQIYNGQAWEGVDGRIWTGSRWIPASSYNIVTLQDMYDIVDATPDFEYIYTESGFWRWWQKSWNAFTEKLFSLLGTGGTGGGSGATGGSGSNGLKDVDLDEDITAADPEEEDGKSLWQFIVLVIDGGKSVVGGVRHLFSGVVSTIPDTMDGITGAFDSGGVAVGLMDGTGSDPDVSVETYSSAEGEVLDPWRYR